MFVDEDPPALYTTHDVKPVSSFFPEIYHQLPLIWLFYAAHKGDWYAVEAIAGHRSWGNRSAESNV